MLRWTTENNGHRHLLYEELADVSPSSTTITKKHLHEVIKQEAPAASPGPANMAMGELGMPPATPMAQPIESPNGIYVIMEADGHTHEIGEEYRFVLADKPDRPKNKDGEEDDAITVKELLEMYNQAKNDEKECRDKGAESYEFRYGNPWDEEDKSNLEKSKRACLAVDEVGALVELLVGYQQQNRTDIFCKPVETGDAPTAEILNILIKNILDKNNYTYEESRTFEDEVTTGRGFFSVYVDYDRDIQGEIRVEHIDWDKPYLGPHNKIDASDLEYLILTDEYSKSKLMRIFPDKKEKIENFFASWTDENSNEAIQPRPGETYDVVKSNEGTVLTYGGEAVANLATKEMKLFERWMKEFYTSYLAIDKSTGNVIEISSGEKDDVKSLGFNIIERSAYRLRITKCAGQILLSDEYSDNKDFPLIPVYANKYKNKFQGKVEPLKDAAREIDKRRSQLADYLNAAMGAIFVEEGSMNPQEMTKFQKNVTNPRHISKISDLSRLPRRTDPIRVPVEFIQEDAISSQKLQTIANMRDLSAVNQSNVSGRALMVQRRASLVGNDFLFDHLDLAKKIMAMRIIEMIQQVYTPERVARIVMSQTQGKLQVNDQEISISEQDIVQMLENADLTKYDITIDESPHSKTMNELTFQMLSELRSQGVQDIDTLTIIDMSPVPYTTKQNIKQGIMKMRQAMMQAEQQKQQSEVEKSMPDEAKIAMLEQRRAGGMVPTGQPTV